MDSASDNSHKTSKITSRFLWTASELIRKVSAGKTSDGHDLNAICTELRARQFAFLDANKDKLHLCPKCHNPWEEGKFKLRIRPVKIPKALRKYRNCVSTSSFKNKLVESLKSKRDNMMILRCLVCNNVSKCYISKPEQKITPNVTTAPSVEFGISMKRKKKKKKDITAGLNVSSLIKKNKIDTSTSDDLVKNTESISSFKEKIEKNRVQKPSFTAESHSSSLVFGNNNFGEIEKVKSVPKKLRLPEKVSSLESSSIVNVIKNSLELNNNSSDRTKVSKNKLKNKKKFKASCAKQKMNDNQLKSSIKDFISSLSNMRQTDFPRPTD